MAPNLFLCDSQTVKKPRMAKPAKKKYVPPLGMFSSMRGLTTPMMKLDIQVVLVVIETPVLLVAKLKISLGRTHLPFVSSAYCV